ncbi:sigma-70 family RNA polymerase sigma factor [Nannocystaceae bacterium ST9]
MSKASIMFCGADSEDRDQLRLGVEIRAIQERIHLGLYRDMLELEVCAAARLRDVIDGLNRYTPTIVHFGGHGEHHGIVLHDDEEIESLVAGERLVAVLHTGQPGLRLAVLNACNTSGLAAQVASVIDCAIGMASVVSDLTARSFASAFYGALAHGRSVQASFEQARLELNFDEDLPMLHCRTGIDPNTLFIVAAKPAVAEREVWIIRLEGHVAEVDVPAREAIRIELTSLAASLRIERIFQGSIEIVASVSRTEAEALREQVEALARIAGHRVIEVYWRGCVPEIDPEIDLLDGPAAPASDRDDREAIARWASDDRQAGDRLIQRHFTPIRAYFHQRMPERLEELVFETFTRLANLASNYRGKSSVRGFVYGIARQVLHEQLAQLRVPARFDPLTSSLAEATGRRLSSMLGEREDRLLLDALQDIPIAAHDLLELRYFRGLTAPELGDLFEIPEASVRGWIRAALGQLERAYPIPEGGEDELERRLTELRPSMLL